MERYIGAHVSAAGGLKNAIKRGDAIGVNSIQTMFSAPMRWAIDQVDQEDIDAMAKVSLGSGVKKVLFHGVYLINLARQEKQKFHLSKESVKSHLDAAARLQKSVNEQGGDMEVLGMTFHPGSALDLSPEDGVKRISYGLNWVLERVEGGMVLLESSAGAGNVMGDKIEELAAMREGVEDKARVAYVLDTQHMFVSGYDWVNDLDGIVDQLESTLCLDLIKAIHLNDSKPEFNSHKDRHENIGDGNIGEEAIKNLLNHPKLKNIPFILETPGLKDADTTAIEISKLKAWAK